MMTTSLLGYRVVNILNRRTVLPVLWFVFGLFFIPELLTTDNLSLRALMSITVTGWLAWSFVWYWQLQRNCKPLPVRLDPSTPTGLSREKVEENTTTTTRKREIVGAVLILFGAILTVYGSYSEYWWPSNPCCTPTYSNLEVGYLPEAIGFFLIGFGIWRCVDITRRGALSVIAAAFALIYGLWLYSTILIVESTSNGGGGGAHFLPYLQLLAPLPFLISGAIFVAMSVIFWRRW